MQELLIELKRDFYELVGLVSVEELAGNTSLPDAIRELQKLLLKAIG